MYDKTNIIKLENDELFRPDMLSYDALRHAEWKLKFTQASTAESSMRDLLGLCASLADGAVFLLDRGFKISFFSGSSCTGSEIAQSLIKGGGANNKHLNYLLKESTDRIIVYDDLDNGDVCWVTKVDLEKTEEFYIVLFTSTKANSNEISILLGMLQDSFFEVNLRRQRGGVAVGDVKAFLNALINGTITTWDEIDAYSKRLPSPPKRYMTIAAAQANPSMGRNSLESLMSRLRALFPYSSAAIIGEHIILMISNDTRIFQPRPVFNEKDMQSLLVQYDGYIAFSNVTQRLDMWRTNYLLADSTLRLGRAIQEQSGSRVFFYEDYAEYISIELSLERYRELMHHDDLLFLTSPDAVTLYRYDHHNGTDLQTVLYYFCKNNGNISLAAKEAFMHRNTFSARMAQIRDVLKDVDLSDGREQHRLLFSCRVFRYYNLYYDKNAPRSLSERLSITE